MVGGVREGETVTMDRWSCLQEEKYAIKNSGWCSLLATTDDRLWEIKQWDSGLESGCRAEK
jgi:hypothetical protein